MSNPTSHQPLESSIGHHHVHRDDEPLPGAKGAEPTVDYSPETIAHTKLPASEEGNTQDFSRHPRSSQDGPYDQAPVGGLGGVTGPPSANPVSGSTTLFGSPGGNTGLPPTPVSDSTTKPSSGGLGGNTSPSSNTGTGSTAKPSSTILGSNTSPSSNTGSGSTAKPSSGSHGGHTGASSNAASHGGSATKPSFGDKVVGKTQELAGKVLQKDALQEKGELRKQGERT